MIVPTATDLQLFTDFLRKYREQFFPVNVGGQNCLQPFFAGQGNYTAYDNHELGNKQYINGGAPAGNGVGSLTGMPPFDFMTGAGVDARVSSNDGHAERRQRAVHEQERRFSEIGAGVRELPAVN